MSMKWLCVATGILLLLAIPSGWPYDFYTLLRWIVFISSLIVINGFYKSKLSGWALVFGATAFLFNPIIPVYLNKSSWVSIDFLVAVFFFLAAYSIKKGKNKSD